MSSLVRGPSLSIVVSSRNHERFVEWCLRSVFAADQEIELIYVDNGSKDKTVAIARETLQSAPAHIKWKVVALNPEQPLCRFANIGIGETTSEFVKPISGDDGVGPNFFSSFRRLVERTDERVGMWLAGSVVIDDNDQVLRGYYSPTLFGSPDDGPPCVLEERQVLNRSHPPLTYVSVILRRKTFYDVGGYDERFRYDDRPFVFNVLKRGWKVLVHPYNNTYFRTHPGSISTDPAWMAEARVPIAFDQMMRAEWRNKPIAAFQLARNLRVVALNRWRKWRTP